MMLSAVMKELDCLFSEHGDIDVMIEFPKKNDKDPDYTSDFFIVQEDSEIVSGEGAKGEQPGESESSIKVRTWLY